MWVITRLVHDVINHVPMSVSFSDTRTGSDQGTEALHESRCLAENKKKQKKIEIIYGFT